MINLASHNSWSYAKPIKWYIPHFMAKCQSLSIKEQYKLGVRFFDLRLKVWGVFYGVAHGPIVFDVNWYKDLKWLDEQGDVYVRTLLEYNKEPKNSPSSIYDFQIMCTMLVREFQHIKFVGGQCKWNGKKAYTFPYTSPATVEKYSSVTSLFKSNNRFLRIIDDWWPWLYAKLRNKKNYKEFCENNKGEYLMLDFVNMIKKYVK